MGGRGLSKVFKYSQLRRVMHDMGSTLAESVKFRNWPYTEILSQLDIFAKLHHQQLQAILVVPAQIQLLYLGPLHQFVPKLLTGNTFTCLKPPRPKYVTIAEDVCDWDIQYVHQLHSM